jgi:hypothetical protein
MADHFSNVVKHSFGTNPLLGSTHMDGLPPVASGKRKADVLEEGGKKKRAKKPKDPNAPKRPASSYLLFQNDIRQELKKKHPNMSHGELLSMISKQWAAMTDEQKAVSQVFCGFGTATDRHVTIVQVYNKANADAKEKYTVAKNAYEARDANSPVVQATTVPAVSVLMSPHSKSFDIDACSYRLPKKHPRRPRRPSLRPS